MVHAYVMVKTGTAASERIVEAARTLPEITEVHIVAGDFDLIAEVEVDEVYEVLQAAASKIQGIEGVVETRTYIALE